MKKYWIPVGLLLAFLSGCALLVPFDEGVPGAPVRFSSPTGTSTPSPTATLVPTPTPTPTPQPEQILEEAEDAYLMGDWEAATAGYRQLLAFPALSQEPLSTATLGLGKALIANGKISEGIALLDDFILSFPEDVLVADAHLALGDALMEAGDASRAAGHYQNVINRLPALSLYAYEWLGDAYFAAADYVQALGSYQSALALATTASQQVFLWEKIALTHAAMQAYDEAIAAYDTILSIAQIPAYRARIAYQAAETARLFGDDTEALRRFHEIVQAYPQQPQAYQALVTLVERGESVDLFLRGYVDYFGEAYGPAVQAFYGAIEADPEHTGEPHYYAALSYLKAGSPQLALNEFETLLSTHPGDAYWGSAWMGKAQALVALERTDEAVEAYRALPDALPDHPRAAEALWQAAELLEEMGQLDAAVTAFLELAERYPDDSGAPEARFRAGLNRYQLGRLDLAIAEWDALRQWYPAHERAQAGLFWTGKAQLQSGNTLSATETFSQAVTFAPWDYYGLRAADFLADRAPFASPAETIDSCGGLQETINWMAGWLNIESPDTLGVPPAELLADARLERGVTLLRLGHFDEGRAELESLREAHSENAWAQLHLALIFRDIHLYRSSILSASAVWRLSPAADIATLPRFLGCLVYPTYFDDLVEAEAQEFNFHPLVLYALLRQESLFEGFATSYAAAHGLMQVIPPTGEQIATALNWPPNYETADLYRPLVSVRFGTWYLAQQRDRFDGELYPAMAGYNGGPGNAAAWWETAGKDRDLFVEFIGFQETRTYVERITEHYARYVWLYGTP